MTPESKRNAVKEYLGTLKIMQQAYRDQFEVGHPEHCRGLPGYDPGSIKRMMQDQPSGGASSSDAPPAAVTSVANYFGTQFRFSAKLPESGNDEGKPDTSGPNEGTESFLGDYWEVFDGGCD